MDTLPASFLIQDEVKRALRLNQPVVALNGWTLPWRMKDGE